MKNLLKIISNDNYLLLNRDLIRELGLDETVLLCELCHEQQYWQDKNSLQKDGFFYSTVENIENQIGIKKKKQLTIINKLKALNLIEVKYHDMPKKRYIKVNVSEIESLQEKYSSKKEAEKIKLTEFDYDIINKVFFEKELSKEIKNTFAEYVLVLKQYKKFDVNLKNMRGLLNSFLQFKDKSIEEQKKIINQSKNKKWKSFYPIREKIKQNSKKEEQKKVSSKSEPYYKSPADTYVQRLQEGYMKKLERSRYGSNYENYI